MRVAMIDVDHQNNKRKKFWVARHRWAAPPPETWASLCGAVTDAAVDAVIRVSEQAPQAPLNLTVESDGGDPLAAFRLYDRLRAHPAPVTTMTSVRCHSAALLAFLGGDIRLAAHNAQFLVHQVERNPTGRPTSARLRAEAADLDLFDQQIAQLICLRAGRYRLWRVRQDMAGEVVLGAEDAHLRGIVTNLAG
jgi:ATP-dependent protease ClpP protease subunit